MSNYTKKQHYIPQFYLSGFTLNFSRDEKIYVLDQNTGRQWKSCIRSIGYENDLYSIDFNGVEKDGIEKGFAKFEDMVAPIIRDIHNKQRIPGGEEFSLLMNFIALMELRVPSVIESHTKVYTDIGKIWLDMITSREDIWNSELTKMKVSGVNVGNTNYEEFKEFVHSDKYKIDVDQNYKMKQLMGKVDIILPYISRRKWSILICEDNHGGFVCSDHPVSLVSPKMTNSFFSPGHGMPDTELTIPLTKNVALIGRFGGSEQVINVNKKTLATINSRSSMYSDKFIFSAKDNFLFIDKNNQVADKRILIKYITEG